MHCLLYFQLVYSSCSIYYWKTILIADAITYTFFTYTLLRPDNGNGNVILNKKDDICGMNNIINDRPKFKLLTADPTSLREGQLQKFLREL